MPQTLSKDDWIEIFISLEARKDTLEAYLYASTLPEESQMLQQWITHLDTILATIGDDGCAMWPREEDPCPTPSTAPTAPPP